MITLPLACTVRQCGLPLTRRDTVYVCAAGHSFDIARSGYVNLLQPQDRHSATAGDSKHAVEARAALEAAGVGRVLVDAVVAWVLEMHLPEHAVIVDLGSGTGEALACLSRRHAIAGIGIDLSTAAADFAARRFPALAWVVANADRRLPLRDHSVHLVLSINGRRNPSECTRVLKEHGQLVVALPAADDLIELRAHVQGRPVERDRVEGMIAEHRPMFQVVERRSSRERVELGREELVNLLRGTYRGARLAALHRVEALERMTVTLSSEVVRLKKLPPERR